MSSVLPLVPPPWTCKISACYLIPWYHSGSRPLPKELAYDRVEANAASFSSENEAGRYRGGLCFAQILRYSETPVGPYDELLIIPGTFDGAGPFKEVKKNLRITGIWVSSRETCMNGRRNWGIPKHMARFTFAPVAGSNAKNIEIRRPDPDGTLFFSATIKPISYTPTFPFSSAWMSLIRIPSYILQPPNPAGEPADIIVKTDQWMRTKSVLATKKAKMCWVDMAQPSTAATTANGAAAADGKKDAMTTITEDGGDAPPLKKKGEGNWWPGMWRWNLGMACTDAVLEVGVPEVRDG